MTTWLVTGAGGFLGRHVLDRLAREAPGDRVYGLSRRPREEPAGVEWIEGSLDSVRSARRAIDESRPEIVLHLGGALPASGAAECFRANVGGTTHLIAALTAAGRPARLVAAGSAAELGPVPADRVPIGEETPCRPVGAYGLSKWAGSRLVLGARGGVEGVVARLFNPIGPGMPEGQALGRFAAILAGEGAEPVRMKVGSLQGRRDFVDVRDVAGALFGLARAGRTGRVYHVGSGVSRPVAAGLSILIGLSGRAVIVERVEGSGSGVADSRASIERIGAEIGWRPTIPFARSLADHWRGLAGPRQGCFVPHPDPHPGPLPGGEGERKGHPPGAGSNLHPYPHPGPLPGGEGERKETLSPRGGGERNPSPLPPGEGAQRAGEGPGLRE